MYFTRMLGFCAALAALFVPGYTSVLARDSAPQVRPLPALAAHASPRAQMAQLPISFEPNVGQVDRRVAFLAHAGGTTLFLTSTGAVLTRTTTTSPPQNRSSLHPQSRLSHPHIKQSVMRMMLVGSSAHPRFSATNRLPGIVNYFIGNDPTKWHANIPTYGKVILHNVYPGIDQAWYGNHGTLEYDWLVHPGADPSRIALRLLGARGLHLDRQGNLLSPSLLGLFGQHAPQTYQAERPIHSMYVLDRSGLIRVRVGAYDRTRLLTIDPSLIYSTYLGGSGGQDGYGIAVDSGGNTYVTGRTGSTDFPTLNAFQSTNGGYTDVFVTKFTPGGSLVYSTYLGGSGGDEGYAIAVDSGGSAYVTGVSDHLIGVTETTDFPTLNAFQSTYGGRYEAFVTKFTATVSSPPFVSASPNPVPGDSSSTTVSWDTRDSSVGQVYVSVNSGAETLVAQGASGSTPVTWIAQQATYLFTLYAGQNHAVRLASVTVTRATPSPPSITASPTTVFPPSTSTTITFTTGDGSTGQVYVSMDGGSEALVTGGTSGSVNIPWISAGHTYVFKLYAGTTHTTVLSSVTVTAPTTAPPSITASPTTVIAPSTSTSISYSTGDGSVGQVYAVMDSGSEALVAQGASGTVNISWIASGHTYFFKLYAGTTHTSLLVATTVYGQGSPSITASPTSVPSGTSTTIAWNTGDGTSGQIYVSVNGGAYVLVASGPPGSVSIPWIQPGNSYLFKLYASTFHSSLLASVTVVGQSTASISANPTSVPTSGGSGSTAITFSTGDGSTGQVYVSMNGGSDVLVTQGSGSTFTVTWIQHSSSYVFKLYAGTGHTTVLGQVTVTGQ